MLIVLSTFAQNINMESQRTTMFRYALHPLDKSLKTYSVSIQELGSFLEPNHKDTLLNKTLVIPGYEKVKAGGDIQVELIMNPLSITSKEQKDEPITNEKDGKKTITHQYYYAIAYNFPTRIRVLAKGQVITEQDFPGYFTTEYYPSNRNSLTILENEYNNDYHFRNVLLGKRIDERKYQIRDWLFSNYGFGLTPRLIEVATVKDKKGEYPAISKGFSLLMTAFASTDKKTNYLDEEYKAKLKEAIALFEKELTEFSEDRKARINEKVAAMLHYNIALAQYGLHELDEAESRLALVKEGTRSVQTEAYRLKEEIQDRRMRLVANGLMKGDLPPPLPKPADPYSANAKTNFHDYIVLVSGDTLADVKFILPSRDVMPYGDSLWLQDQVIIIEDGKTIEIKAQNINAYSYNGKIRETRTWYDKEATLTFNTAYQMCERLEMGAISLYKCHSIETSMRDPNRKFVRTFPYYKRDKLFNIAVYGNFNKGVAKLVADYPELSARVASGEFMEGDLLKVIREYNAWAESKK